MGPFLKGDGPIDLLCGQCLQVLVSGPFVLWECDGRVSGLADLADGVFEFPLPFSAAVWELTARQACFR